MGERANVDLKQLDVLKRKLATSSDFMEPWRYFLDCFAEDATFMRLGDRHKGSDLEGVIAAISGKLLSQNVSVDQALLTEIEGHEFVHGVCVVGGKMAGVIFFKDIDMGLLAITMSNRGGEILLSRFSTGRGTGWSELPAMPETIH
jgi:hypothetical protein